jgi:hypothetical protein
MYCSTWLSHDGSATILWLKFSSYSTRVSYMLLPSRSAIRRRHGLRYNLQLERWNGEHSLKHNIRGQQFQRTTPVQPPSISTNALSAVLSFNLQYANWILSAILRWLASNNNIRNLRGYSQQLSEQLSVEPNVPELPLLSELSVEPNVPELPLLSELSVEPNVPELPLLSRL